MYTVQSFPTPNIDDIFSLYIQETDKMIKRIIVKGKMKMRSRQMIQR